MERPISGCAIYSPGVPGLPANPFGKDVANIGLWRALARYADFDELCFVLNRPVGPGELQRILFNGSTGRTRLKTTGVFDLGSLSRMGILVRGSADIVEFAW